MWTCHSCRHEWNGNNNSYIKCPNCGIWQISKGDRIDRAEEILKEAFDKIEELGIQIRMHDGAVLDQYNYPLLAVDDTGILKH